MMLHLYLPPNGFSLWSWKHLRYGSSYHKVSPTGGFFYPENRSD
jgi:hypothetical protein